MKNLTRVILGIVVRMVMVLIVVRMVMVLMVISYTK